MAIQVDKKEPLPTMNTPGKIIITWHNDGLFTDLNQTDNGEQANANVLPTVLFGVLSFILMLALVEVLDYLVRGWLRFGCYSQVRPAQHG